MNEKTKPIPANWELIFEELPKAIRQLKSHDANSSLEAAMLLNAALAVLRSRGAQEAYDAILAMLLDLAQLAERLGSRLTESTALVLRDLEEPLLERLGENSDHMIAMRLGS